MKVLVDPMEIILQAWLLGLVATVVTKPTSPESMTCSEAVLCQLDRLPMSLHNPGFDYICKLSKADSMTPESYDPRCVGTWVRN